MLLIILLLDIIQYLVEIALIRLKVLLLVAGASLVGALAIYI